MWTWKLALALRKPGFPIFRAIRRCLEGFDVGRPFPFSPLRQHELTANTNFKRASDHSWDNCSTSKAAKGSVHDHSSKV